MMVVFDLQKQMDKTKSVYSLTPAISRKPRANTTSIREIFKLGAGGDPKLPEGLRNCDANCDKISIDLNT